MTQEHPITPPPELVQAFLRSNPFTPAEMTYEQFIATRFARWGADQELEACCEWLQEQLGEDRWETPVCLRLARRPNPPSLKAQALEALKHAEEGWRPIPEDCALIRRALESLPD